MRERRRRARGSLAGIGAPEEARGLQLEDSTARPIALSHLRPNQPNHGFEIVRPKIGGLAQLP